MTGGELLRIVEELFMLANIEFVDLSRLNPYINVAKRISPDPKDTLYAALAIFEVRPIWSNDKLLKEAQNLIQVMDTTEIYKMI